MNIRFDRLAALIIAAACAGCATEGKVLTPAEQQAENARQFGRMDAANANREQMRETRDTLRERQSNRER